MFFTFTFYWVWFDIIQTGYIFIYEQLEYTQNAFHLQHKHFNDCMYLNYV